MGPDYGSDNPNQTWLNLGRDGTVYARRNGPLGPQVQVYYPDRDVLSDWLPVKQMGAAGAAFHFCPRVGDNVTVLNLGSGIEQGAVIGGHGTDNNPVFIPNTIDSVALGTDDGAFFEHEPQSGTTTLAGIGTLHISVNGETLAFSGLWTLNASGNVSITAPNATIKAGKITLDGDVHITKTLTVDGKVNFKAGGTANPSIINQDGSGGGS